MCREVDVTESKVRIAHLAGSTATIQNTPPLVTSNKARSKSGLPLRANENGTEQKFDALRAQRLAAPVKIYVEQFSAHPLEADASELYGPPDGYIDIEGSFNPTRRSAADKPVYEIELRPEDGLYPEGAANHCIKSRHYAASVSASLRPSVLRFEAVFTRTSISCSKAALEKMARS